MEKFGIFELLDTLSALADREEIAPSPEPEAPAPVAPADLPRSERPVKTDALGSLLARHDAISRKIDDKNK